MILITGSNGKIGSSVVKYLNNKKINFIQTKRSKKYIKINKKSIGLDLLNENHIKKIFSIYNFKHLIHLAVTRNPLHIKQIRSYSTLKADTLMIINLLKYCHNLKSLSFTSSASVYELPDVRDSIKRELIAKKIGNFLQRKNKVKIKIETISKKKRKNLKINPIFHKNYNKRLNGSSKLINELILISFCLEKKISLYILRPFYVIESLKEKKLLQDKINNIKSKKN